MYTMELLRKILGEFNTVFNYLSNTNIAAAVSQLEDLGALVAQYSQTRAEQVYALIDKTSDVICHIENRVPAEYEKCRKAVTTLYAGIVGDYLIANDSNFNRMTRTSREVIAYAQRRDRYAFTLAKQLGPLMRDYSYKAGADYLYYVEGLAYAGTDFEKLIRLTQEYCGATMKEAISSFTSRL